MFSRHMARRRAALAGEATVWAEEATWDEERREEGGGLWRRWEEDLRAGVEQQEEHA